VSRIRASGADDAHCVAVVALRVRGSFVLARLFRTMSSGTLPPTQAAWQSLQRDLWRWQCPARLLNPPIPWKNSRRMYGCSFLARVTGLVDGPIEVE